MTNEINTIISDIRRIRNVSLLQIKMLISKYKEITDKKDQTRVLHFLGEKCLLEGSYGYYQESYYISIFKCATYYIKEDAVLSDLIEILGLNNEAPNAASIPLKLSFAGQLEEEHLDRRKKLTWPMKILIELKKGNIHQLLQGNYFKANPENVKYIAFLYSPERPGWGENGHVEHLVDILCHSKMSEDHSKSFFNGLVEITQNTLLPILIRKLESYLNDVAILDSEKRTKGTTELLTFVLEHARVADINLCLKNLAKIFTDREKRAKYDDKPNKSTNCLFMEIKKQVDAYLHNNNISHNEWEAYHKLRAENAKKKDILSWFQSPSKETREIALEDIQPSSTRRYSCSN